METVIHTVNAAITLLFFLCYAYQFAYIPVVWWGKESRQTQPTRMHNFAVLISARNEATVIADLLESIWSQTYDRSLITTFVIADNCTDATAAIARAGGAVVYERFDRQHIGKGYALDALLQHIRRDYPEGFDGYFVFDADNILEPDYIERMNESFSQGNEIITGYRNSKNFGDNWISSGYALWFLRESRYLNGARYALGSSCAVSGTGFFFSQKILENMGGWHFYLLTEDIQFSVHQILRGHRIAFCREAVLYDEQPTSFSQSCRQRMRWAKGYVQVFQRYGLSLIKGVINGSWSCFDMSMAIMPAFILSSASILLNGLLMVWSVLNGMGIWLAAGSLAECLGGMYLTLLLIGAVTTVTEWRQIRAPLWRKLVTVATFPLFMFTYIPISVAALFLHVEWKPIVHTVSARKLNNS